MEKIELAPGPQHHDEPDETMLHKTMQQVASEHQKTVKKSSVTKPDPKFERFAQPKAQIIRPEERKRIELEKQ